MENLSNIKTIKEILSSHGFTFSKALGQNFLINPSVCPKMAMESGAGDNIGVIEVGPGIGVLTNELAKIAKKVVAIEIDDRLIPVLAQTLSDFDNVKVIHGDVLKLDLHKIIEEEFSGMQVVVCANLPYYITSPVIMKLLEDKLRINAITVMVQKEAAQRICAKVGTRQSGAVTVSVNYYSEPKMLFGVSAGSFMPAPNVDSAVIRLDIFKEPKVEVFDEKTFFKVVRAAFSQRRKTLANSLSSGLSQPKEVINQLMQACSLAANLRPEQLSMQDFASLANAYYERDKK